MATFSVIDTNTLTTDRANVSEGEAHAYITRAADLTGHIYKVISHAVIGSNRIG